MPQSDFRIVLGGEAGQGLQTLGALLAQTLVRAGYHLIAVQSYLSRIRGGHNEFMIRYGLDPLHADRERCDLLVALDAESVPAQEPFFTANSPVLFPSSLALDHPRRTVIPTDHFGPRLFENVAMAGVIGTWLGLPITILRETLTDLLGKKAALEENVKVLMAAAQWASEAPPPIRGCPPLPPTPSRRLMLNGNEALALGAIAGGLRFAAFYPMTPSTSVALTLIRHADQAGLVVEQAEDEIAAINMAIGASFAGAPSLVATSGGGFALMVEGVSLAAMTETPIVIVVAQRPAPATGLPTRTEQGDLEFVLHAGHGEFPRAILTPGSPEQCFDLARHAMELAEQFQGPIFILTDQYLADTYRSVDPPPLSPMSLPPRLPPPQIPYRRYAFAPGGLSPRAVPQPGIAYVVADSDEHTEDGHITEDLDIRRRMVEKRLAKGQGLVAAARPPDWIGPEHPERLLICWGSTLGPAREAAERLTGNGHPTAVLHFTQVWPLPIETFRAKLVAAPKTVVVEGNATGQFARLLRRETGLDFPRRINRFDGLPFTPETILRALSHE